MKNIRQYIIAGAVCMALAGCGGRGAEVAIDSALMHEIDRAMADLQELMQDEYFEYYQLGDYYSSLATTAVLVDFNVWEEDTVVNITLFDTTIRDYPEPEYFDCFRAANRGYDIYISDTAHLGILYNDPVEQRQTCRKMCVGISRMFLYHNGELMAMPLPPDDDEETEVDLAETDSYTDD